jgi:hypothetical protein
VRKLFLRSLIVTAVAQFVVTRHMAGRVIEEGRAERLWMMYPLNVVMNALAWTLILGGIGRVARVVRRAV